MNPENQSTNRRIDCDRCGRDRPADPERFSITVSDFTDGTAAYMKVLLCVECWRQQRANLRRCLA